MIFDQKSEIYCRKQYFRLERDEEMLNKNSFVNLIDKFTNNINIFFIRYGFNNAEFSKDKTNKIYSHIYVNRNGFWHYQNYEINDSLKNEVLQLNFDIIESPYIDYYYMVI